LKNNILKIGTTGTETRFLAEGDLPECARLTGASSDDKMEAEDVEYQRALEKSLAEKGGKCESTK
jgi:DNA damage-inducible protein 1